MGTLPCRPIFLGWSLAELQCDSEADARDATEAAGAVPGQDAHSQGFCAELHPPALCQLLQLVPRPGQVPHKVPVKARLLQVHRGGQTAWMLAASGVWLPEKMRSLKSKRALQATRICIVRCKTSYTLSCTDRP